MRAIIAWCIYFMKFKQLIHKLNRPGKPLLAVLIDPDKFNPAVVDLANNCAVSCFLVGGSILHHGNISKTVAAIKKISAIPVVLFPGDETQLTPLADGLFLPSLISGNNPDYLIGKQVMMAPLIKRYKLQHQAMAYLLIDGKNVSSTQKISGTTPLNAKNLKLISNMALAAQMLGFKLLYLEAGSGAKTTIPSAIVKLVKKQVQLPLIVGGGIDSAKKVRLLINAGANMIVVGNALEKNVSLLTKISSAIDR